MEKTRFSQLLLEPGEIYFEDFKASKFTPNMTEAEYDRQHQVGRLKLCSKSLVFDPSDISQPVLKIPLDKCLDIIQGKRSWVEGEDNVIEIDCQSHVEMLEGNVIAPYKFVKERKTLSFLLSFANIEDCLSQIAQLHRASTLLHSDQESMIAAIVFSRQARFRFDLKWLENLYENIIIETQAQKIGPLVVNPGRVLLSSARIYFQPYNNDEAYPVLKVNLKNIVRIICRRFLLKQVGIDVTFTKGLNTENVDHFYFILKSKEERDRFYSMMLQQPDLSPNTVDQEIMTLKWQNRAISTYDYLLYLNSMADRSFHDLSQYPVFPWVLSNYTSQELDLNDEKNYRDLSKPMGALNEYRLMRLKERMEDMQDPKFLYGSHYSAPGFVLYYLVRKFPQYMLCLQNGKFDHPDRMFNSVSDTWRNVTTHMSDFKELTPEFYDVTQGGDFLLNTYGINFGIRSDGTRVHDVELPPWANSPADFVAKLRDALESEFVSSNIHRWIDLIFGYKQRGEEAKKSDNLFYYLCYEGAVDIDSVADYENKHALEVQIMEYGQIPKQIFKVPHPPRRTLVPSVGISALSTTQELLNVTWENITNLEKTKIVTKHKDTVTSVGVSSDKKFIITGSRDSTMKMISTQTDTQLRSIQMRNAGISTCLLLPGDEIIIAGTFDNQIVVYDINYGTMIDSIIGHEDTVTSLSWGEREKCLVSTSWDCTLKIWNGMFQKDRWHRLKIDSVYRFDFDARVTCSVINDDNTLIGAGTDEGDLIIINLQTKHLKLREKIHTARVSGVSFSPDGSKMVSCALDGTFKIYDITTGLELYSKSQEIELSALVWDGQTLVLGSNRGYIYLWDLIQVKLTKKIKCHGQKINCIAVSKDGRLIVTGEDEFVAVRT